MPRIIDGTLADWTEADRLDYPGLGVTGVALYGTYESGQYVFGLSSSTVIGAGTTFWLNSDRNIATGQQVFGGTADTGAEFYIDFVTNLVTNTTSPFLYKAGGAFVSPITAAYSTDGKTVEFSVAAAAIAPVAPPASAGLDLKIDINNVTFVPGNYAGNTLTVKDAATLPPVTEHPPKIGIVYSETSAKSYFGGSDAGQMAYAQLFMAAQNQATAAGIPFDLLSETDLTDLAKLSTYDALVFPSFRNVAPDKVAAIQDVLTDAVYKYNVGLITAGDFMTNGPATATNLVGDVLPGDPYIRMKTLLDLTREGGSATVGGTAVAINATGSGFDGYGTNELVQSYAKMSTSWYASVDGKPVTPIATQTLTEDNITRNAVVGTETGGKNVHFANESLLGDNNMLQHAIDYIVGPTTGPDLSLHMSRDKAIVASRTDMDQAQEMADVNPEGNAPGIYDKLLPILEQWKEKYNFVGSYYIDIGNNPTGGQSTDWTVSKPYYDQLLQMGNEIGSHTISHPENTNLLTLAEIETEFGGSKTIIEQNLGQPIKGVAVPGAPEFLPVSKAVEQYYTYMTGGAALLGAGYPGAIGHLDPADSKVYIAPNMSFDFTLIGFQGKTVAEAAATWNAEFDSLTSHSDMPVIVWPWHDYGPTAWPLDPNVASKYTEALFTGFLDTASAFGSEFVTLADLAQRTASFGISDLDYSYDAAANIINATVTSADAGKFALDLGSLGTSKIKSVASAAGTGWYAYDDDSVFLDKNGEAVSISLGAISDDVTHLYDIADRAELLSVSGDGKNLSFSVVGEGKFLVDLANPTGQTVQVTSTTDTTFVQSLVGDKLALTFTGLGTHDVSVKMVGPAGGTNNPPTVSGPLTMAATEGGAAIVQDLLANATDPDPGDQSTLTVGPLSYATGTTVSANPPQGLTYDAAAHKLTVDPGSATFDHLALGATETITVGYEILDAKGAKAAQTSTITITGVNDAPKAAAALTATVTKGETASKYDLLTGATDADDNAVLTVANMTYAVDGGTATGTAPGGMSYDALTHMLSFDPKDNAYADLGVGVSRKILLSYDVMDEHGAFFQQTHTLTVNGAPAAGGGDGGGTPPGNGGGTPPGDGGGTPPGDGGGTPDSGSGGGGVIGGGGETAPEPLNRPYFGTVSYDVQSNAGEVYALYDAVFDRPSDVGGQQYWTNALDSGMSLQELAATLLQSPEGQTRFGTSDNTAFVESLYQSALHRSGEPEGIQYWSNALAQGTSKADVAMGFAFSGENVASIQPALDSGIFTSDSQAVDVSRLYYCLLDRAPDANGLQWHTDAFESGTSLLSIAQSFLGSSEYAAKFGALSDDAFVTALYDGALGRTPDMAGFEAWTSALESGAGRAEVALGIAGSPEAQNHLFSSIEAGWHLIA